MKKIIVLIVFFFVVTMSFGQIVGWRMDFPGNANDAAGNEITLDATVLDPNLNMSTLSRGAGINVSPLARAFSSTGYQVNGTQATALANDEYMEFQISAMAGFEVSLATLDVNFRISNKGPTNFLWRYSIDGTNFTDIGLPFTYNSPPSGGRPQAQIDLSVIPALQNVVSGRAVTFRLYGWGATDPGGTFAIGRRNGVELAIGGLVEVAFCSDGLVTWDGTAWQPNAPTMNSRVVIDGDYTVDNLNSFPACMLFINEVSSSTGNPVTVIVGNGGFIEVENEVTVEGTLIVETQGNFVQRGNTGTFTVGSTGVSRVNKTTAVKDKWYFYTYWGSPVVNETIENVFPLVDPDRRFFFEAANFIDEHTRGTNNNIPDDIDDNGDDWNFATGPMLPGVGYACTESRPFTPGTGSATFQGAFNTSDITIPIVQNAANVVSGASSWNLISNPYPSAIDFNAFQAANASVVDGAAYFWSQVSPPNGVNAGNQQLNFSKNDYAIYTVGSGSIIAGAAGMMPNRYVPSGQGFFVVGLDNNTAVFTNAMRSASTITNNLFFKNVETKKQPAANVDANRLWVNLTSDNGVFNQILVAYVPGATNGNDGLSYDAPRLVNQDYAALLYSAMDLGQRKYAIQGKNVESLNENEVINLGFATTIATQTTYKLSVAQLEGDFLTGNALYLQDNLLGVVHNLSDSDYEFTSEVGEFNNRFKIVFNTSVLATTPIDATAHTLKIVELKDNRVRFSASSSIKSVVIFDMLGRPLYHLKGANTIETYNMSGISSAIYIAKVTLANGITLTKKAFKK